MGIENIISGVGARIGSAATGIGLGFGKGGLSISANFNGRLQQKLSVSEQKAPLKELLKNQKSQDIIFPADLDTDHYILFTKTGRTTNQSSGTKTETEDFTIALPLPSNLNPTYNARYTDQPMGIAGAFASGKLSPDDVTRSAELVKQQYEDITKKFTSFGETGTTDAETKSRIKNTAASATTILGAATVGKMFGGNVGAVLGAAVGGAGTAVQGFLSAQNVAINSHLAVLFDGVGFRTFSFNYRFVPRNPDESVELRKMIHAFKKAMYPSLPADNKFLFTYPDEFNIEFADAIKPQMFKFKRSVLKDFAVSYNGDGVPRFFDDGTPTVVDIQMTFQEVEIITKEDMLSPEDSV